MPVVLPDLPRQRNSFDGGVYVLKFFDLLYGRPPPVRAGRDSTFSGQFAKNLFTRADVLAERKRLAAFFDTRAAAAAATPRARPPAGNRAAGNRDVAADLAAAMPEARARQRRAVARSAPSSAPAAAVDLTAGADFVIPPIRQSYLRRAPDDDAVPAAPPVRPRLKKARGATTSSAPPRAPKAKSTKPLKGFMLFSKEMRPRVKADDPDLTFGGIGKRLGEIWRGLSDAEKARYNK